MSFSMDSMAFLESDASNIIAGKFLLDLTEVTLQQKCADPITYRGTGTVFYDDEGQLSLRMICTYQNEKEANDNFFRLRERGDRCKSWQLMPDDEYFKLDAVDIYGKRWKAEHLFIKEPTRSGWLKELIIFVIEDITHQEKCKEEENFKVRFYTKSKLGFPTYINHNSDGTQYTDIGEFSSNNISFYPEKFNDDSLFVRASLGEAISHENAGRMLIEALRIVSGRFIQPLLYIEEYKGKRTIRIQSRKDLMERKKISPPINCGSGEERKCLSLFIASYLSSRIEPVSLLYQYWFRVLDSHRNHFESEALILTAVIEGVLREYFRLWGEPSEAYKKEAEEAKCVIKNVSLPRNIRDRILSLIGNSDFSASRAFRKLVDSGILEKKMHTIWNNLRNKGAHGNSMEFEENGIQKTSDQIWVCLAIFYILLMRAINYTGKFINYAKPDWPEENMPQFSDEATQRHPLSS